MGTDALQQCTALSTSHVNDIVPRPVVDQAAWMEEVDALAARDVVRPELELSFAGGGIYFFWQLGCVAYLARHVDLTRARMVGASAGAIVAAISACGVDPTRALESAYALSVEHGVWERPMGLAGVWGNIIRTWLYELLPEDAHTRCSGRVEIISTLLFPSLTQVVHSEFTSKDDLIAAIMASAHVPWLLDWNMATRFRGELHLDGSLADFVAGDNSPLLVKDGATLLFDYSQDAALELGHRMSFLELKDYDQIKAIMLQGEAYAEALLRDGALDTFEWAHLSVDGDDCDAGRRAALML